MRCNKVTQGRQGRTCATKEQTNEYLDLPPVKAIMTNRIRHLCSECASWYEYEPGYESDEYCQRCLYGMIEGIKEDAETDAGVLREALKESENSLCANEVDYDELETERDRALSKIARLENQIEDLELALEEVTSKKAEVEKQEAPSDTVKLAAIVGKILIEEMFQLDKKGIKRALKRLEGMLL